MASFSDLWTFESPLVLFQDLRIIQVYVVLFSLLPKDTLLRTYLMTYTFFSAVD